MWSCAENIYHTRDGKQFLKVKHGAEIKSSQKQLYPQKVNTEIYEYWLTLEAASSGHTRNCSVYHFHNSVIVYRT